MTRLSDETIGAIPGWFGPPDVDLFRLLLDATGDQVGGNLVELGVYLGKSAVLVGDSRAPGERFVVVDTFGASDLDEANQTENDASYGKLSRQEFERNYRSVHGDLPEVIEGLSSSITEAVEPGTCRFLHIDASHLYEHVAGDIAASRQMSKPDAVIVIDDYRSPHTPGVAAAAWTAVANGLRPFAVTEMKMYATWGDAERWAGLVDDWAIANATSVFTQVQDVAGHRVRFLIREPRRVERLVPPALLPVASRWFRRLKRGVAVRTSGPFALLTRRSRSR